MGEVIQGPWKKVDSSENPHEKCTKLVHFLMNDDVKNPGSCNEVEIKGLLQILEDPRNKELDMLDTITKRDASEWRKFPSQFHAQVRMLIQRLHERRGETDSLPIGLRAALRAYQFRFNISTTGSRVE